MDKQQLLKQELGALQHELRRVNDALERNHTHDQELNARRLRDNIALCEVELKNCIRQATGNNIAPCR